jgi:hypothetical protein
LQETQSLRDPRYLLEEVPGLSYGEVQHIRDRCALEANLQGLSIESSSAADVAFDFQVWEKLEFDLLDSMSLAGFTPTAGIVEAEACAAESEPFRIGGAGEDFADLIEET